MAGRSGSGGGRGGSRGRSAARSGGRSGARKASSGAARKASSGTRRVNHCTMCERQVAEEQRRIRAGQKRKEQQQLRRQAKNPALTRSSFGGGGFAGQGGFGGGGFSGGRSRALGESFGRPSRLPSFGSGFQSVNGFGRDWNDDFEGHKKASKKGWKGVFARYARETGRGRARAASGGGGRSSGSRSGSKASKSSKSRSTKRSGGSSMAGWFDVGRDFSGGSSRGRSASSSSSGRSSSRSSGRDHRSGSGSSSRGSRGSRSSGRGGRSSFSPNYDRDLSRDWNDEPIRHKRAAVLGWKRRLGRKKPARPTFGGYRPVLFHPVDEWRARSNRGRDASSGRGGSANFGERMAALREGGRGQSRSGRSSGSKRDHSRSNSGMNFGERMAMIRAQSGGSRGGRGGRGRDW